MRFAVDAHAIGRHLTGNEVYVRSLLNALAAQDQDDDFIAYVSADSAAQALPSSITTRRIATNPFRAAWLRPCHEGAAGPARSAPRAVHRAAGLSGSGGGQRSRREFSGASRVFHPRSRLAVAVDGAAYRAPRGQDSDRQRVFPLVDPQGVRRSGREQGGGGTQRGGRRSSGPCLAKRPSPACATDSKLPLPLCCRWATCSRARTRSA